MLQPTGHVAVTGARGGSVPTRGSQCTVRPRAAREGGGREGRACGRAGGRPAGAGVGVDRAGRCPRCARTSGSWPPTARAGPCRTTWPTWWAPSACLLGDPVPEAAGEAPAHVRNPVGEANERWVAARRHLPVPTCWPSWARWRRAAWPPCGPCRPSGGRSRAPRRSARCPTGSSWPCGPWTRGCTSRTSAGPWAAPATSRARWPSWPSTGWASGVPFVVGKRAGAPDASTVVVRGHRARGPHADRGRGGRPCPPGRHRARRPDGAHHHGAARPSPA